MGGWRGEGRDGSERQKGKGVIMIKIHTAFKEEKNEKNQETTKY